MRRAVSGIFVLGPEDEGFVEKPAAEACACEGSPDCEFETVTDVSDGESYKLCPAEGLVNQLLDSTYTNPDVTGVVLRLDWKDIHLDDATFFFDDLDRQMDLAVRNGKLFTLDVRAGRNGTPAWIFDAAATSHPVTPLSFLDWGSEDEPPFTNKCGIEFFPPNGSYLGGPNDKNYRRHYKRMIQEIAAHVASDSRWFQAMAHMKVSGMNLLSSEARLPKRCYDSGDADLLLDTIGAGPHSSCVCNTKVWADSGYKPSALYKYYRIMASEIFLGFGTKKSLGFQLIQAGFPRIESSTNWFGDSLFDQGGAPLLPGGITGDDPGGTEQTEEVLEQLRNGRFVDPRGSGSDPVAGKLFIPQHSGVGRMREDDGQPTGCSQSQGVDAVNERANFPIPLGTSADGESGCPNRFAVEEGTLCGQAMGFQTNNAKEVANPADVESALWNLTLNSNAVFVELYEQRVWDIRHRMGTGSSGEVLDPSRTGNGGPAPYTKTLNAWTKELHRRRKLLATDAAGDAVPYLEKPFPSKHEHHFLGSVPAGSNEVYYYYVNPWKCSSTSDPARVGRIRFTP
ncbi:MAG: hypothetical protein FJ148_20395 [Deltaproteobacteria bacterium]|nr:hypothetical protein [Deltaproteobacteria bacterium]